MHTYLHCLLHCTPRPSAAPSSGRHVASGSGVGCVHTGAGEPVVVPSRLEALRWVHSDSALVEGRLVGANAVQLGGSLHLAAYVFHREAVKARRRRVAGRRRRRWEARLRREVRQQAPPLPFSTPAY
jgi:hypothetical protein